jgi:hypothetical protein
MYFKIGNYIERQRIRMIRSSILIAPAIADIHRFTLARFRILVRLASPGIKWRILDDELIDIITILVA